jgi:hypothetical protein
MICYQAHSSDVITVSLSGPASWLVTKQTEGSCSLVREVPGGQEHLHNHRGHAAYMGEMRNFIQIMAGKFQDNISLERQG